MADAIEVVIREVEQSSKVCDLVDENDITADSVVDATGTESVDVVSRDLDEAVVDSPDMVAIEEDADLSDVREDSDVITSETDETSEELEEEDDIDDDDDADEFVDAGEEVEGVEGVVEQQPWVTERRHSGDGEEQPDKAVDVKKLDDDEDRHNPAYVPRKGAFFEHDLRIGEEADDEGKADNDAKKLPKKLWNETLKWQHDRFDEKCQAPKSRDEIVATYGFDIRSMNDGTSSGRSRSAKKSRSSHHNKGVQLGDYINTNNSTPAQEPRDSQSVEKRAPLVQTEVRTVDSRPQNEDREVSGIVSKQSAHRQGPSSAKRRGGVAVGTGRSRRPLGTGRLMQNIVTGTRGTSSATHTEKPRPVSADGGSHAGEVGSPVRRGSAPRTDHQQSSQAPPRLSRTIRTSSGPTSRVIRNITDSSNNANSTVAITIVTESQDARRCFPEPTRTSAAGERRSEKKSTLIVHTTMAPEIIPPVTRMVTYSKSAKPIRSKCGSGSMQPSIGEGGSQREPSRGWTGGEFTPANRLPNADASYAMSGGRTKRYSSQRQRSAQESGSTDLPSTETLPPTSLVSSTQVVTTMLHPSGRPIPATAFYANPRQLSPAQIQLFAGSLASNSGGPTIVGARPLLHTPYIAGPTGPVPMLPHGPFMAPQVLGYGPPLASPTGANFVPVQFAGVPLPEVGGNPLEVRGGTVYFSTETQKPAGDVHVGTMYFDPGQQTASASNARSPGRRPNAAIPIVNPQDLMVKSEPDGQVDVTETSQGQSDRQVDTTEISQSQPDGQVDASEISQSQPDSQVDASENAEIQAKKPDTDDLPEADETPVSATSANTVETDQGSSATADEQVTNVEE